MITLLRRLLGVVLVLAGLAALVVGGWFARALGTDGVATFEASPATDLPVVIDAETNARTDYPLLITATAEDDVPITLSITGPSDADTLLADSRHLRVSGVEIREGGLTAEREWELDTETVGTTDPITPATADLWRSQETVQGQVTIEGDLESAPETMILTTPDGEQIERITMAWTNPAWFYQALSLVFAGLLTALVGLALVLRRATPRDPTVRRKDAATTTDAAARDSAAVTTPTAKDPA